MNSSCTSRQLLKFVNTKQNNLDQEVFSQQEIEMLFAARNADIKNQTGEKESLKRFREYCAAYCKNKKANLQSLTLKDESAQVLFRILSMNTNLVHLDLDKNMLRDSGIVHLCKAFVYTRSLIYLNVS